MTRTTTAMSLLLLLGATAVDLQAQWPDSRTGGSTAGLTFSPGNRMVTVTWLKAVADTNTRYRLFRTTDSARVGADVSGPLRETTFTDKTLQLGTTYFYYVQAERPSVPGAPPARPRTSAPMKFMLARLVPVALPTVKKKP
jgi:hypothetical protein